MIKSFKHKGLAELFERGGSRRVRHDLQSRSLRRLEALDQAESLMDLNVPRFNFHGLQGIPKRYSETFAKRPLLPNFCVPDERDLSTGSNFTRSEALALSSKYSKYGCLSRFHRGG